MKNIKPILLFFILFTSINDTFAQSIIGKWECQTITYNITKQDGTTKANPNKVKEKGMIMTWEFLSNGKLIATESGQSQEAKWELKGNQLTVKGDFTKALAMSLGTTDLIYVVEITGNVLNLSVDATKIGPYKKNILTYSYLKI